MKWKNLEVNGATVIRIKFLEYLVHKCSGLCAGEYGAVHLHHLVLAQLPVGVILANMVTINVMWDTHVTVITSINPLNHSVISAAS